jgi:hypothetical protein
MGRMDCYPGEYLHHIVLWLPNHHQTKARWKKEDSGKNGTYTGHQQANNYSTGLRKSLNSSFMTTKITTSKRSSTVLPPRPPLITDSDPATDSHNLQTTHLAIQSWLRDWRIKANETKSVHVTFTSRRETCPPVHINDVQIPQENHVKFLGLHLYRRLTWHTHIFAKRKQLGLSLTEMYWLLGRKSKFSTSNKLLIYKVILNTHYSVPIWTYDIQPWGTTFN